MANSVIKVACLGGSITAQAGWRPKTLAHFQKSYPKVTFSEINAAIPGAGSDLGVCRLEQDVLAENPDLLFVEFTVNDGGTDGVARGVLPHLQTVFRATQPGASLTFKFKGTRVSIYDVIGSDSGQVIVTLDDQPPKTVAHFNGTTYYPGAILLVGDLVE